MENGNGGRSETLSGSGNAAPAASAKLRHDLDMASARARRTRAGRIRNAEQQNARDQETAVAVRASRAPPSKSRALKESTEALMTHYRSMAPHERFGRSPVAQHSRPIPSVNTRLEATILVSENHGADERPISFGDSTILFIRLTFANADDDFEWRKSVTFDFSNSVC
jgi:hypothetical protein